MRASRYDVLYAQAPPTEKQAHSPTRRVISFLTQEEVKRLFAAIKTKRDRAIFLTAYRHGLRACKIGYCPRNASVL